MKINILLIGLSGYGKTTLIKNLLNYKNINTKHQHNKDIVILETCESDTIECNNYHFHIKGKCYEIIDTPGLNDSRHRDNLFIDKIMLYLLKCIDGIHKIYFVIPLTEERISPPIQILINFIVQLIGVNNLHYVTFLLNKIDMFKHKTELDAKINKWKEQISEYLYSEHKYDNKINFCLSSREHINSFIENMSNINEKSSFYTNAMKEYKSIYDEMQKIRAKYSIKDYEYKENEKMLKELEQKITITYMDSTSEFRQKLDEIRDITNKFNITKGIKKYKLSDYISKLMIMEDENKDDDEKNVDELDF